jgi:hypothetical protein
MLAIEKIHKTQAKEYEKVLKVISHPLKEGHHFDQNLGGVAGFFENMRQNTQGLINTNLETEKSIKGSVLPMVERLHKEIKSKTKELSGGVVKGTKEVEKARNATQKQIEFLGQHTAGFESVGSKMESSLDPYVICRGVTHRLHKQVLEENNHHNDLIAVQNNFRPFEAHIIEVMQQSMEAFTQLAAGQGEKVRALHSDMLGAIQRIPPDFEWKGFQGRYQHVLINPNDNPRSVDSIHFANMDHPSTKPLIEGTLERKSRNKLSWGYQTGYYVITPSKFLHEFKDSDDIRAEPKPELSIYLPEAVAGFADGDKFSVKGKDKSGKMSGKFSGSSELSFKAHTTMDAKRWFETIKALTGAATNDIASPATATSPISPIVPVLSPDDKLPDSKKGSVASVSSTAEHKSQEAGITGEDKTVSPEPMSPVNTKESTPASPVVATTSSPATTVQAATTTPIAVTAEKKE